MEEVDPDGWVSVDHPDPPRQIHLRYARDERGRIRIAALRITGNGAPIAKEHLLAVPLARLEAQANSPTMHDGGRPTIRRPTDRMLPDAFLSDVATAYSVLAIEGRKPAPVIAAEAEVPVTTAHRWIKEARRRGLLAPARRGATG